MRLLSCDTIFAWRKLLSTLPIDCSNQTIERNRNVISSISQRSRIVSILEEILQDPKVLMEIAARSYHHINHFDKIVLIGDDNPCAYRLTLHLWQPPYTERELREESIHDHRFNFWSAILTGTLKSENFDASETGKVFRSYRYIPEQRSYKFNDFYEFCGEVKLAARNISSKFSGRTYFLAAPSIHKILLPRDCLTCTLVLRGPRLKSYSTVFNTGYPRYDTSFDNVMFSREALAGKLEALLAALKNQISDLPAITHAPSDQQQLPNARAEWRPGFTI